MRIALFTLMLFSFSMSYAQIDMAYRRANAVALYEFLETSGNVVNDTSSVNPKLNLTIADASSNSIERSSGTLYIKSRNLIQSAGAATKIIDACKASGELSIETWIEDAEPVKKLVGEYPSKTAQPNRIVSLNTDIRHSNFYVGQFYNNDELLYSAINTSGNENAAGVTDVTKAGGNLNNPIVSMPNQIIIPSLETMDPPRVPMQKIVVTLSKNSVAKIYMSDRDGNMTKAATDSTGFGMNGAAFKNWYTGAKLSLGNVSSTLNEVQNAPGNFTTCTGATANNDPACAANSRYWKGKLHLVAIYCKALSDTDVLGSIANSQLLNKTLAPNINVNITDNLKKAQDIFQRLTGVKTPLYDPVLAQMETQLNQNNVIAAADIAASDSRFLNITVRDFASKMSNRSETIDTPLNDFTATVIGAVRDGISAQRLLWDNITYIGDTSKVAVPSTMASDILKSNNHYDALDLQHADLAKVLKMSDQKIYDGTKAVDMPTPAGLLTSRAWLSAHAVAGTNRRLVEYSFREFLCTPLEKVADSTGPDNVVARDIDRFPGGSHTKFTTTCRACHTIMDGFRPAFGYFTFNGGYAMHSFTSATVGTQQEEDDGKGMFKSKEPGALYVHDKLNKNATVFPGGRVTTDDNWINDAANGANLPYFNWTRMSGKGIQEFGKMLAESKQFPICMATRVYTQVCKRAPSSSETTMLNAAATDFASKNYNLKYLFEKIVTTKECLGGN
jgi:hypothetical protein